MNTPEHIASHVKNSGPLLCLDLGKTIHTLCACPEKDPGEWPLSPLDSGHNSAIPGAEHLPHCTACLVAVEIPFEPNDPLNGWSEFWSCLLEKTHGNPLAWLFAAPWPVWFDKTAQASLPENSLLASSAVAAVCGLLADPVLSARTLRQGITVVYCGTSRMTFFLLYRQRVWGVCEHAVKRPLGDILTDLKEFQLTWLPDEVVRASGGAGSVFVRPVPDEAESFSPVYVLGPNAAMLEGHGRIPGDENEDRLIRFHGLLHAHSLAVTQEELK